MSISEQLITTPLEDPARRRRQLLSGVVYLALIALALYVSGQQFLGADSDKVWPVLRSAKPEWFALAVLFEATRYCCVGFVARQIAAMLGQSMRRRDTAQMMLASLAVNRVFSAGGTTAFIVRLQYFARCGFTLGRTLGLVITQNVVSSSALFIVYVIGMSVLWVRGDLDGLKPLAALGWIVVIFGAAGAQTYLGLHPNLLERVVATVLARFDNRFRRLFARALHQPDALKKFVSDLSASVNVTMRNPRGLLLALAFQATALASDIITLFIAFQALRVPIEPGLVIAAYIVAYYAQLLAPTPGEAGAMEFVLPITLTALGVSPLNAATATLLFRFVSFWLPIPFGLMAYFNLKRQGKV